MKEQQHGEQAGIDGTMDAHSASVTDTAHDEAQEASHAAPARLRSYRAS